MHRSIATLRENRIVGTIIPAENVLAAAGHWANLRFIQPAAGVAMLGECCSAAA